MEQSYNKEYVKGLFRDIIEYIKKYVDDDNEAMYHMGYCYYAGIGATKNINKAIELFKEASDKGNLDAQTSLGVLYLQGEGVEKDINKAIELFKESSNKGNADGQYRLGVCYYNGNGVEKDIDKAIELFKKASEQGNANGQYCLGVCYYNGEGVEKDIDKAIELFKKASDKGHTKAQILLGLCYCNGKGVEKNINKAVELFKKASEKEDVDAQYYLGICYYFGEGIKKDIDKALELFEISASKGNSNARLILSLCYYRGDVIKNDEVYTEKNERNLKLEALPSEKDCNINNMIKDIFSITKIMNSKVNDIFSTEKTIKNTLEKTSDNIITVKNKLEESNKSFAEKYVKSIFRNKWNKLSDLSKKYLITEEVLWKSISEKTDDDFRGVCNYLISALELELNKYFFKNYKDYLQKEYGNPSFDSWPQSMLSITEKEFNEKMNKYEKRECKKPYLKAKNTFTLGNLPYILCDKFSKDISEDEKKK